MFYETAAGAPLPSDPFKALVAPRPIGWISTVSPEGVGNLAPFSFFNAVSDAPPMVMFSAGPSPRGRAKDTVANAEQTGEFVVNIVDHALRDAMNATSAAHPPGVDEAAAAGIAMAECALVRPRRVAAAPAALECRMHALIPLPGVGGAAGYSLLLGRVVGVHIADNALIDGRFDAAGRRLLARMGYRDYVVCDSLFALSRPDEDRLGQR